MRPIYRFLVVTLIFLLLGAIGTLFERAARPTEARAGIVGTNLFALASLSAGTNTSTSFVPPQTYTIVPLTFTVYHSETNAGVTNYLEVSFDGGATWAVLASRQNSTSATTETWTPTLTSLAPTNRIRVVNTNAQTYFIQGNWIQ